MPDDGDLNLYYDFLTIVAWWNLYGLPALLAVVAVVVVVILARRHARSAKIAGLVDDGTLAVRRIGLIHYGLALRAGIFLVQELLTMRIDGDSGVARDPDPIGDRGGHQPAVGSWPAPAPSPEPDPAVGDRMVYVFVVDRHLYDLLVVALPRGRRSGEVAR